MRAAIRRVRCRSSRTAIVLAGSRELRARLWRLERGVERGLGQGGRDPRYCGHSYLIADCLGGGYGCGLGSDGSIMKCDSRECGNVRKWDFVREGLVLDERKVLVDFARILEEQPECPYCRRKRGYGKHRDWCLLGEVQRMKHTG